MAMLSLGLALLFAGTATADPVGFESERWEIQQGEVSEFLGRDCFQGRAVLKDVALEDGVIEVDVAFSGERAFVGLLFRMVSDQEYENVYLRPHKSRMPDALQYTPVHHGSSAWQLHTGDGFIAAAAIPEKRWVHLRLEFAGDQARLFLNDDPEPALAISDLKRDRVPGWVGVSGPANGRGCFADFSYRSDDTLAFPEPTRRAPVAGMLTDWELSPPFELHQVDGERAPQQQKIAEAGWRKVTADEHGLVNISRFAARPGPGPSVIFARTVLHADGDELRELNFGYSDALILFVNGRRVFGGSAFFNSRSAGFLGAVGLYDTAFLPLREGENLLELIVYEAFGGWGFMAQDAGWVHRDPRLEESWRIAAGRFDMPESAAYDPGRERFYVTHFGQYSPAGRQSVSTVRLDGTIEQRDWVTGLARPTGAVVHGDRLFVVERRALVEIDPASARIVTRHTFPDPVFPNDVAAGPSGDLYVSDSGRGAIYRLSDGNVEVWLDGEEVDRPNGLLVHDDGLVWGNTGDRTLKRAGLANREVQTLAELGPGTIDGLQRDGDRGYLVSHANGRLYAVSADGGVKLILDTSAGGYRIADFAYVPEKRLLVVPTLTANVLMSYRLLE